MDANDLPPPPFTNQVIGAATIPRLAEAEFTPLDPKLLTSRILTVAAVSIVALIASIASGVLVSPLWLLVSLGVLVVAAVVVLLQRIEIAHMGYAVRERDFSFRSGVLSRSVATVPYARVQHVTIENGPVERRFGLSTLELRTAGQSISVPGLSESVARDLKGLVVARAGELADAEHDPDRPDR